MDKLIQLLQNEHHSLVIASDGIRTFNGRGVSDLYHILHENADILREAYVADKVVGKAAAALMALAAVKEVYADVISQPAFDLLDSAGILTTYGKLVPHIINRTGTGLCPLETRCMACVTPEECLVQIRTFIKEMKTNELKE